MMCVLKGIYLIVTHTYNPHDVACNAVLRSYTAIWHVQGVYLTGLWINLILKKQFHIKSRHVNKQICQLAPCA